MARGRVVDVLVAALAASAVLAPVGLLLDELPVRFPTILEAPLWFLAVGLASALLARRRRTTS